MTQAISEPITEIAYECGFRNQSNFNRVFLARTGMTPREYRNSHGESLSLSAGLLAKKRIILTSLRYELYNRLHLCYNERKSNERLVQQ